MSNLAESLDPAFSAVKNLEILPYCTGTLPWDKECTLFYKSNKEESRFIHFPATKSQLEDLFSSCTGGEIDAHDFTLSFSLYDEGLASILEKTLIQEIEIQNLKVELSRLNVYGPGESPKAHKETPLSMIASVVVILPTIHEGGLLILRHDEKEWTFDSSNAVSSIPNAQAAFIASFSDVDHEWVSVSSGYRVTLTYSLYLKKAGKARSILTSEQQQTLKLEEALQRLLKDPTFLPDGGYFGFGLNRKYTSDADSPPDLCDIKDRLKGSDAIIKRACERLSLIVSVKAIFFDPDDKGKAVLYRPSTEIEYNDEAIAGYLKDTFGGKTVVDYEYWQDKMEDADWIVYLRPLDKTNGFKFCFICDDHKQPLTYDEANICLVAWTPSARERCLA